MPAPARLPFLAAALAALALGGPAGATTLLADDFEGAAPGASYTVVDDGTPDGSVTFGFDYAGAGIPLAPRSAPGGGSGLRLTVNDGAGAPDAYTAFHETAVAGDYTMWVDVYLGVTGTGGTTEHAHVGVGGDGITLHQYSDPSGSGAFLAFDGDGGSGSFDYVHFTEEAGRVPTGDASYLAGSGSNLEPLYQGLFPATNGSPANLWTTLRIAVAGGTVTYALDGTPIVSASTAATDGFVSLGYADVFSSLAEPAQSQFVLYDNLRVAVPEPAPALLVAGGLLLLGAGRRRPR